MTLTLHNRLPPRLLAFIRDWWYVLPLLGIAYYVRAWSMYGMGNYGDHAINSIWAHTALDSGILNIYRTTNTDYPPLYLMFLTIAASLQSTTGWNAFHPLILPLYRFLPILSELALILVAMIWLRKRPVLRWLIPLIFALQPGLVATTAFWGQSDSVFTLLIVLALIALNDDKPLAAWVFFAIGILTKFQSVFILPLLFMLSWRRYGIPKTLLGMAIAGGIGVLFLTPFVLNSGLDKTLAPYGTSVDRYPVTTLNAFNFWHVLAGLTSNNPLEPVGDGARVLGPLTLKHFGFLMLGLNILLVCLSIWREPKARREFVWGATLYWGMFVLTTQMHERYLYPGVVLVTLAVAQDRRLWFAALVSIFTYTYNVMSFTSDPFIFVGIPLYTMLTGISIPVALINVCLYIELLPVAVLPKSKAVFVRRLSHTVVLIAGAACLLLLGTHYWEFSRTARWLEDHVADRSRIVYPDTAGAAMYFSNSEAARTWQWQRQTFYEDQHPSAFIGEGIHYMVINDATDELFQHHVDALTADGAMLLYEATPPLQNWHQGVLWTFRPEICTQATFDNALELVGYRWQDSSLLLYWYARQPLIDYQVFVHILDPETGEMVDQADQALGGFDHPSSSWRRSEIVFESIDLPPIAQDAVIQIGLYELASGRRAQISDWQGNALGDSLALHLPDETASDPETSGCERLLP